ncbi:ABC transporter ATP-binding protein [Selenihalanaerobacter shriftii]|uniref:ABC-type quaternary amine transporter n=1 Tax=Selenihalanaerobacter shriftii TaxID=142842 RepID=A0A1T4K5B5_9FIRM|nr:ABC transporter ATP-binding protein [Selenihalanaerobacter shriftii]SJZ37619.1 ABC-type Fe3+/spermidine/putrescine transport systems, ATPase components [Selenihalanaerobacter shriftii]
MVEISLKDLTKSFDDELVIDSLDLTIKPGELVALLGPSGCGKTTTLKIISGLLVPDAGDILFDQESVLSVSAETRGAVLVFQEYLLFPHMNVADNIGFGLKMRGESKENIHKRVTELLELVSLTGYEEDYPHELSGGQRQRIALARSLAINPQVLLLDEPLSNLDANLREEMQNLIRNLHVEENMTTIFVTHDRDEAMLMADRIAVMNEGQIEQYGKPEKLYKKPETKFVADFFGKTNYIKGRIEAGKFHFMNSYLSVSNEVTTFNIEEYEGKTIEAMIRPEFIEFITNDYEEKQDKKLYLSGTISERRFVGERVFYQIDIGEQILRVTTLPQFSLSIGDEVNMKINLENIWFME